MVGSKRILGHLLSDVNRQFVNSLVFQLTEDVIVLTIFVQVHEFLLEIVEDC
jgi:hypothetical protein